LILQLLSAQHLVHPGPLRYDLCLTDPECVAVTVQEAGTLVAYAPNPSPSEVDFRVEGDLAGLARLLTAGPIRRRLGRGVAKVKWGRRPFAALRALASAPVGLADLDAAGVRLDASAALRLVSLMIEPRWTTGERFTLGYASGVGRRERGYLRVRDGSRPLGSTEAPLGPVGTTIVCPPDVLIAVLVGSERAAAADIRGDTRPLTLVQQWIARAQQG
jgi:hypothetical protein